MEFDEMMCMKCDGKPIMAGTGHCRPCVTGGMRERPSPRLVAKMRHSQRVIDYYLELPQWKIVLWKLGLYRPTPPKE